MYVVIDTSVLIAAFLHPGGLNDRILRLETERYLICLSEAILAECRGKLIELGAKRECVDQFLGQLSRIHAVCDEREYSAEEVRLDHHIVGCLRKCRADLIVTNDKALLRRLKQVDIPVVRPSTFQSFL